MVEIYLEDGFCLQTAMTLEGVLAILEDEFVSPEAYVRIKLQDGCISAFRKKNVVGISEITEFIEV